jgi:small subunit ribosomal protein S2
MSNDNISLFYEDMLKAGMHFGRRRTVFNPAMGKYVFTVRNGICIIDLLKTSQEISIVAQAIKSAIDKGNLVLFVGLNKQSADSMKSLAVEMEMPYVVDRWLGGTLTNYKIISARVKLLEEMEKQSVSGELEKYTKKERLMFEKKIAKMRTSFDGLRKLTRLPEIVFVSSLKEGGIVVRETKRMGIKVIAIANTDANPKSADWIIPANDRSKKSIDVILDLLRKELKS